MRTQGGKRFFAKMSQEAMNMKVDWDDGAPVVHVGDANDEIDEDPDWGTFYGDKLVPRGMDSGVSYDDQRLI